MLLASLFALLALSQAAPARPAVPESEAARIEALLERYAACGKLDGAVAVARRGELVYQGAFGLANREHGVPCTTATRFSMGSGRLRPLPRSGP